MNAGVLDTGFPEALFNTVLLIGKMNAGSPEAL